MQGFLDQGFSALYNVEGMGADGAAHFSAKRPPKSNLTKHSTEIYHNRG